MDLSWLGERHVNAAYAVVHLDDLIEQIGETLNTWADHPDRPLRLREEHHGTYKALVVDAAAAVPPKVPLLVADAFNQMRSLLEHVVFAEVCAAVGRELTEREERSLEIPNCTTLSKLEGWVTESRARDGLKVLAPGSELFERLERIQLFEDEGDRSQHHLTRLIEYTNLAKHRRPVIANVMVPVVLSDDQPLPRSLEDLELRSDGPVQPGDVLKKADPERLTIVDSFPTIGMLRQSIGEWTILMNELNELFDWVRLYAIPTLVGADPFAVDALPATFDITDAVSGGLAAASAGSMVSAGERLDLKRNVALLREDVPGYICTIAPDLGFANVEAWVTALDDKVFESIAQVATASGGAGAAFNNMDLYHEVVELTMCCRADLKGDGGTATC